MFAFFYGYLTKIPQASLCDIIMNADLSWKPYIKIEHTGVFQEKI